MSPVAMDLTVNLGDKTQATKISNTECGDFVYVRSTNKGDNIYH